jgi:hypothetical protein
MQPSDIFSISFLSGNLALDLAVLFLAALAVFRITHKAANHIHAISSQKERARKMTLSLSKDDKTIASLREELLGARQQTQAVLTPYLEELDQVRKMAAAIEERELDPEHESLETQLQQATYKPRHPGH